MISKYSWPNKVILIVEDDAYSILLLKSILSPTGVSLLFAEDGESAVDLIRNGIPIDMVLMDIRLKGISGLEATAQIKRYSPKIPIIAQTACAMVGDQERCLNAGCDDYLSKPIEVISLLEAINTYFKHKSANGMLSTSILAN